MFGHSWLVPEMISNPDDPSQSAQIVRYVSLTQLGALHAISSEDMDGGQTREGCATVPGDEHIAADSSATGANG